LFIDGLEYENGLLISGDDGDGGGDWRCFFGFDFCSVSSVCDDVGTVATYLFLCWLTRLILAKGLLMS
jgi:hypothetical protein